MDCRKELWTLLDSWLNGADICNGMSGISADERSVLQIVTREEQMEFKAT